MQPQLSYAESLQNFLYMGDIKSLEQMEAIPMVNRLKELNANAEMILTILDIAYPVLKDKINLNNDSDLKSRYKTEIELIDKIKERALELKRVAQPVIHPSPAMKPAPLPAFPQPKVQSPQIHAPRQVVELANELSTLFNGFSDKELDCLDILSRHNGFTSPAGWTDLKNWAQTLSKQRNDFVRNKIMSTPKATPLSEGTLSNIIDSSSTYTVTYGGYNNPTVYSLQGSLMLELLKSINEKVKKFINS